MLEANSIFMHNYNALFHNAGIVRNWLESKEISTVEQSPCSPGRKPIENLWESLKADITRAHSELALMGNEE
jgi:transposase